MNEYNYYIDRLTGEVYAYKADGSEDAFMREGLELLSADELAGIRAAQEAAAQPTPAQIEAATIAQLEAKQRQANAQVTALQGRIDTLVYLIDDQDPEDLDYIDPTPAEIAELPVRKAQLKLWNAYRVKLGRVTGIAGWYQTPTWPVMPEPYTSEMSAVTPASA